jgi:hypothetical protein
MWAADIVPPAPPFDDNFSRLPRGKYFPPQQLTAEFPVERFHTPILPGAPWFKE